MVSRKSDSLAVCKLDIELTTTEVFSHFADKPWAILLDSADAQHSDARYDIISFDPIATLTTREDQTQFTIYDSERCDGLLNNISNENPFSLLKRNLNKLYPKQLSSEFPFNGGVLGSFSYDLGRRVEHLPTTAKNDLSLPDMCIGFYDWSLIFDYQQQSWFLLHYLGEQALEKIKQSLLGMIATKVEINEPFKLTEHWHTQIEKYQYKEKFNRVHEYLLSGDCYQINLTQRFSSSYKGNEWQAYQKLRSSNKAPFSAFIKLEHHSIISISPERFIQLADRHIQTKPIKGTLPRSKNTTIDVQLANQLQQSQKDRAENLMITDLLRNDLGKVASAGTVRVPKLFDIESFPAVHHLVSTVTAELDEKYEATDLLEATFPGGSITGAPKIRAMEIIEELEPSRRSIYCGSIGYISQDGKMDTSITIRTLLTENNKIYCWAGGGIVADSQVDAEYQETFDKVSKILPTLED
ncbi:aminodeoxychorismate synthase component I [Parashewanella tropica]|uniref:aminodeoxychorismate synthase component I n=1 Tax=Parashewanella tropica TaxID=2547970 RepID=UPI00105A3E13|nr:aminodeoxychorismate synthase component I [Parashewanella tropica]